MPQSPLLGQPLQLALAAQTVPASGVTVIDAPDSFDGTDLETILQEIVTLIDESTGAMVPYFIASDETFTVPEFKQALFNMPIDVEGTLVVDGYLLEVA
jgi:hypothetical protein